MEAVQDRAAFHEARRKGIGGSDAPVILGLSKWKTPLQLWLEKTGRLGETADTPILRRGRKLEAVVASEYEIETGRKLDAFTPVSRVDRPWQIGHIDRLIVADAEHDGTGVFEGKAANVFKIREWDEEAPLPAQVQLQHYLAVTGLKWGSVAGLLGGIDFKYQDFTRNDEFIEKLTAAEAAFWKLVQDDTPPEPTGRDTKLIGKVFEVLQGKTIDLPDEALDLDCERLQVCAEIKRLEELRDDAEAKLKFMLHDAEYGRLPGGLGTYSFKNQNRKAYTVAATSFRSLRRSS